MNYVAAWVLHPGNTPSWTLERTTHPHTEVARVFPNGAGFAGWRKGVEFWSDTLAQCADDVERWATVRGDLPAGPIDRSAFG